LGDSYDGIKLVPIIKVQVKDSIVSYNCDNYKKEVAQTE
jgi:hypothetical protein